MAAILKITFLNTLSSRKSPYFESKSHEFFSQGSQTPNYNCNIPLLVQVMA